MNSGCTHTGIDEQLVKEERIKTKPANISFEVFNIDNTKNREVMRFALLEVEINKHKKQINMAVIDLNGMDMFLGHNWLVKHNLEFNWKKGVIWFIRYLRTCKTSYQDITFKTRRAQTMDM